MPYNKISFSSHPPPSLSKVAFVVLAFYNIAVCVVFKTKDMVRSFSASSSLFLFSYHAVIHSSLHTLLLHGIFGGPFSGRAVMSLPVRLEELRDIGHQRVIGIGVGQEAANAQQDFGNGESGRPLVLQNVQADPAVRVDVAVVNASRKVDLGRLERVISRKVNVQKEDSTGIRRFVRSHNGRLPVEHVVTDGSGTAVGRRVFTEVDQFWARRGGRALV